MRLELLDTKHPSYAADLWADCDALYRGGKAFQERIGRFLPQNPLEPLDVYGKRKSESHYRSYLGPIIDYYAAWLFSATFHVRASSSETGKPVDSPDPFYGQWKEDVSGDVDLADFVKERFTVALVQGKAHWLVEFPADGAVAPVSKAEFNDRGLGDATLRAVERSEVYDWEVGQDGELLWVNIHEIAATRASLAAPRTTITERWRVYDRENVETFETTYEAKQRPAATSDIRSVGMRKHGAMQVPLVTLDLPDGLWVAARIMAAQLEHYRLSSALGWAIRRTCYAMPVFKLKDEQRPPVMGTGYYMMIGIDEDCDWISPDSGPFEIIAKQIGEQRDEIFRISHQLALAVDNNSTAAFGRSGQSKEADALSTKVMLNAFGASVREALEETYEVLSDGRGDVDLTFSIEGLDAFDTQSTTSLLANATTSQLVGIPSRTFQVEVKTRAALAMVPDAEQSVKDKIRKEIEEGVAAEEQMRLDMKASEEADREDAQANDAPPGKKPATGAAKLAKDAKAAKAA